MAAKLYNAFVISIQYTYAIKIGISGGQIWIFYTMKITEIIRFANEVSPEGSNSLHPTLTMQSSSKSPSLPKSLIYAV